MPLYWLRYRQDQDVCVLIVETSILGAARMSVEHELVPGIDAHLETAEQLDPASAGRIPEHFIGRPLLEPDLEELELLMAPKMPPAPSVRRRASAIRKRA